MGGNRNSSSVLVGLAFLMITGCQTSGPGTPSTFRIPVLETVVQSNRGLRIVPEEPDGSYTILPVPGNLLRFRVQSDANLRVSVNGADLPRRAQATSDSGWFEPDGRLQDSGSRRFFWDIATVLPTRALDPTKKTATVTVNYDTVTTATQPRLDVLLRLQGRDPSHLLNLPKPSEVFVGSTENTKDDNRMETAIVARGVTLAGWVMDPGRNDGTAFAGTTGSEDWHYDLFLDPDFIERNYGLPVLVEPLPSSALPGNVVPLIRGAATPVPLLSSDPARASSRPTAATFTLPGTGGFTVELNAWHTWSGARGPRPREWVDDPDSFRYSGNAWPFNPFKGTANASGTNLAPGDYVIVSGTLWQDTAHAQNPRSDTDFLRNCFDNLYKGHGGWLELHPVDAVHRVDPPSPRKHVVSLSACYPQRPNFDTHLKHTDDPPSATAQLRYRVIVDDRFTTSNAVHTEFVDGACDPPSLRVTANVPGSGSFSATYILWWEETGQPRTRGTAICIPAISPILGAAKD